MGAMTKRKTACGLARGGCFDGGRQPGGGVDPTRAIEALDPVALAHVLDPYLRTAARGMDELVVADVDTDMAERRPHGVEEHQIARLEFVLADGLGRARLLGGAARQHHAQALLVDRAHEAAAVHAILEVIATVFVAHAQEAHGVDDQLGGNRAHVLAHALETRDQPFSSHQLAHRVGLAGGLGSGKAADRGESDGNDQ